VHETHSLGVATEKRGPPIAEVYCLAMAIAIDVSWCKQCSVSIFSRRLWLWINVQSSD